MSEPRFKQTSWKLDDLLPAYQGPAFEQILAQLEAAVAAVESQRPHLSPDLGIASFQRLLEQIKQVRELAVRLGAYGALWFASDTQSSQALNYQNQVDELLTQVENRLLFFSLWWKGLDDEPAHRLLAASGDDVYYLETLRRFKPHTLSEAEEKVINIKDVNGVNALNTIYSMITNGLAFHLEVDGEVKELTRSELSIYIQGPDPDLRAAAYQEMYRVFGDQSPVLAQIYNHIVRDWNSENVTLRQFASPIAARNLANDIPDPVVDTLLQVCRENVGLFQRYFRWKARMLGMDRLRRYDIYAPVSTSDKRYSFDQAAELVLDTFARFSPTLARQAQRVFEQVHLDAEIRKGKDSGAFWMSPTHSCVPTPRPASPSGMPARPSPGRAHGRPPHARSAVPVLL